MNGKVCAVTGANVGIGLETARELARLGATVVMAVRSRARGEAALEEVRRTVPGAKAELHELDLASLSAIRASAATLAARHPRLDVLVNNAGLFVTARSATSDGFETTFGVNHLGPFLFTNLLLESIKAAAPSRIVNVASDEHYKTRGLDFDDLQMTTGRFSGIEAYRRSKLANVLFTRELARRLSGTRVTACSLHPGAVATSIGKDGDARGIIRILLAIARPFLLSPEAGARTSVHLASAPEVEGVTGRYFEKCREKTPARAALDDEAARRLWDESARLVGLAPA